MLKEFSFNLVGGKFYLKRGCGKTEFIYEIIFSVDLISFVQFKDYMISIRIEDCDNWLAHNEAKIFL